MTISHRKPFSCFFRIIQRFVRPLVLLMCFYGLRVGAAQVIYVNKNSTASIEYGTNWATAYRELSTALQNPIVSSGTAATPVQIWIAKGTYKPTAGTDRHATFHLPSNVVVAGGFAGTEITGLEPRYANNLTILSGDIGTPMTNSITDGRYPPPIYSTNFAFEPGFMDNSYNVVTISDSMNVFLQNVIIVSGNADGATEIGVTNAIPEMMTPDPGDNAGFSKRKLSPLVAGGGLFGTNCSVVMVQVEFINNFAALGGGAALGEDHTAYADQCAFLGNYAPSGGGAMFEVAPDSTMEKCSFYFNQSDTEGGAVKYLAFHRDKKAQMTDSQKAMAHMVGTFQSKAAGVGLGDADAIARTRFGGMIAQLAVSSLKKAVTGSGEIEVESKGGKAGFALMAYGLAIDIMLATLPDGTAKDVVKNLHDYATIDGYTELLELQIAKLGGLIEDQITSPDQKAHDEALAAKRLFHDAYGNNTDGLLLHCKFVQNKAQVGGAVAVNHANINFDGCLFQENSADFMAGAVFDTTLTVPKFVNCVFYKNSSDQGFSALANSLQSRAQVINCTFLQNSSNSKEIGHAIGSMLGSDIRVVNCIMWSNSTPDLVAGGADIFSAMSTNVGPATYSMAAGDQFQLVAITEVRNSCLQGLTNLIEGHDDITPGCLSDRPGDDDSFCFTPEGGAINMGEGCRPGTKSRYGNISVYPGFSDDFRVFNGSPTLDTGDITLWNNGVVNTPRRIDYNEQPRVQYGKIDMGATEGAGFAAHLYVKPGGSGNQNGSSWTNAMSSLSAAIRAGSSEIWVAAGTYYPTTSGDRTAAFIITNNMSIYGGFNGTEVNLSDRNPTNNVTIMSGDIGTVGDDSDNSYKVIYCDSHVNYWTVIDGFTITKGRGTDSAAGNSSGGGAQCYQASPRFQNCKFIDNLAKTGGAVYSTGIEGPSFLNCQFLNNASTQDGGGAIHSGARLRLENCSFTRNTAPNGGAVDLATTEYSYLYNCLFVSNSITGANFVFGSALFAGGGDCSLDNCTFYNNTATAPNVSLSNNGAAFYAQSGGGRSIRNSIFWNNTVTNTTGSQLTVERQQIGFSTGTTVSLTRNLIQGLTTLTDYNNFDRDPFFVNTNTGDFHLAAYSSLIDAGITNGGNLNTDLDGNLRVVGASIDIGAYELQTAATPVIAQVYKQRNCDPGGTIQTFVFDTGTNNYGFTGYQWEIDRNDGLGFRVLANDSVHTGATTATLTFTRPPISLNGFHYRIRASGTAYQYVSPYLVLSASASVVYVRANATGNNTGTDWTNAYTSLQAAVGVPDAWDIYQHYTAGTQILDNGVRYRALTTHDSTDSNRPPETNAWAEVLVDECSQIWVAAGTYYVSNDVSVAVNRYNVSFTNYTTYDDGYVATNVTTTLVYGSTNYIPGNNFKVLSLFDTTTKNIIGALRMRSNLRIYGGFTGTETNLSQRNWRVNQSIISGNIGDPTSDSDNADHLFYNLGNQVGYAADSTAVLDGFTLTKARNSAIYNSAASPVIQNCIFLNNNGASGGAIYNVNSASPAVVNCTFSGNTAGDGAAVYNSSATFSATNCVFNQNSARYRAGALFNGGTMNLVNCVVANNSGEISGGGLLSFTSAKILNSIFWNNRVVGGSSPTVETAQIDRYVATNNVVVSNSCVQGLSVYTGNSNIQYDPLFLNASTADFRLDAASPAVNAGNSAFANAASVDLAGNPRIYSSSAVDMGAYELQSAAAPTAFFYSTPQTISSCSVGGSALFSLTATADASRTFIWQKNGISGFTNLTTDTTYSIASNATNTTLTIQNVSVAMNGNLFRVIELNSHYTSAPVALYLTAPSVIYVNAGNVSGAHTGGSWASAFTDLPSALALADQCSEIWVAKGTYTNAQALALKSGVSILGGFSGMETVREQRNWNVNPVYLRGVNNEIIFNNFSLEPGDHTPLLDGFRIQAPPGRYAVYNDGVSPTYRNITFEYNSGYCAVYNGRSSASYTDCMFRSNSCPSIGNFSSSPRITGCTFLKNTISGHGMIQNVGASSIIDRCIFNGNSADGGAGVYNDINSVTQISDSLFFRNTARTFRGGAIEDYSQGLTLVNCTITENSAAYESGGVYLQQDTANVANCIFWKNNVSSPSQRSNALELAQIAVDPIGLSTVTISNSCIQGLTAFAGNSNIGYDPLFANPVLSDYHLGGGSPAINAGNSYAASILSLDLESNPRAVGVVDLGAYEVQSGSSTSVQLLSLPEYQSACSGQPVAFTVSTVAAMTNIQWQMDTNGFSAVPTNDGIHSITTSGNSSTLNIASVSTELNNRQYRFILPGANYTSAPVTLSVSASSVLYVKPSAGSNGAGTSWANALTNLAQAVGMADQCTEIWVAAGTSTINTVPMRLKQGVRIYGGFAGTETQRSQRNWQTNISLLFGMGSAVIDNDGSIQTTDLTTVLDGFSIMSPFGTPGIRNNYSSFTIQNCTFTNCFPGLCNINGANPVVSNCVFIKNTDGAVWNVASAPTFTDCQFLTNYSSAAGGAISNSFAQALFNRCSFIGNNSSQQGGAIYGDADSSLTLRNCLLRNNSSDTYGGAIDQNGPNLSIVNSTIFHNYAALGGGGLHGSSASGFVANSIFWKNTIGNSSTAELAQIKGDNSIVVVSNSCLQGLTVYSGNNNIPYDPLFIDENGNDLHLGGFSPAVDAGNNGFTDSTLDLDKTNRTFGGIVDIGAYERQTTASGVIRLYALSQVASVCTGHQVSFSLSGTNMVGSNFVWQVNVFGTGTNFTTNYTTITNGGTYTVLVTSNSSALVIPDVDYNMQYNKYRVVDTVSGFVSSPFTFNATDPSILRVKADATGSGNGSDWQNAYTNLNDAFASASGCTEIWVAAGTYAGPTLNLTPSMQVFGGFKGTEVARGQRNASLNPTIVQQTIQTTTNYGVVDAGTLIDGFKFTGGGHIENTNGSPTIRNCIFEALSTYAVNNVNSAAVIDSCVFTNNLISAVRNSGSSTYILNCVFTGNSATNGAAIYNSYSTPTIVDCLFRTNRATSGAALWNSFSSPLVDRCAFKGNMDGSAVLTVGTNSAPTFYNCSFINNTSQSYGGAIAHLGGTLRVVNCTITLNTAAASGGGIYALAPFSIENSILWNNSLTFPDKLLTLEQYQVQTNGITGTISNSCVQGLSAYVGNNIAYDPLLVDAGNGDLHLGDYSPAINAGNNSALVGFNLDLDRQPRTFGTAVDLGAFERQSNALGVVQLFSSPLSQSACVQRTLTFTVTGTNGSGSTFQWQVLSGTNYVTVTNDSQVTITVSSNSSTLTVIPTSVYTKYYRVILAGSGFVPSYFTFASTQPTVLYVKPTALVSGGGDSWANAFRTVQEALPLSDECTEIWVAAGTNAATSKPIALKSGVQLYGGFVGTETSRSQRNWTNNISVLLGSATDSVVENVGGTVSLGRSAVLDGFTIRAQNNQAGIHNYGASPTIRNCMFTGFSGPAIWNNISSSALIDNCTFATNDVSATGLAVVYNFNASPVITNCLFIGNHGMFSGAIENNSSAAAIGSCRFVRNSADYFAGAIWNESHSSSLIVNCWFQTNSASGSGGAIYNSDDASETISGCLFVGNVAQQGGAIYHGSSATCSLLNSTLYGNQAASMFGGGGGVAQSSGDLQIRNSILWLNRDQTISQNIEQAQFVSTGGTWSISNSCIEGLGSYAGNNNIQFDPLFVDPDTQNFRLSAFSPAVNQGNNASVLPVPDLDNNVRIFGANVDVGAYELQSAASSPVQLTGTPASQLTCTAHIARFTASGLASTMSGVQWQVYSNSQFFNITNDSTYLVTTTTTNSTLTIANTLPSMAGLKYRILINGTSYASALATLNFGVTDIIYVRSTAPAGGNGLSWATAYQDLAPAIAAGDSCSEIWVAAGTYNVNSLSMKSGLAIYGGFNGSETARTQRNWQNNVASLQGTGYLFNNYGGTVAIDRSAVLDGLYLSSIGTSGAAVMINEQASPTLRNCTIENCTDGGIVNQIGSSPLIEFCTFTNNKSECISSSYSAPVISQSLFIRNRLTAIENNIASTSTVANCVFVGNVSTTRAGAGILNIQAAKVTIANCVFNNNISDDGGAVSFRNSTNIVYNCTFNQNIGTDSGGAIYVQDGKTSLINNTIVQNSSADGGGLFYAGSTSAVDVKNCIFWKNTQSTLAYSSEVAQIYDASSGITTQNSIIQGMDANTGSGNLGFDPLFYNLSTGDLRIASDSPAVNAGNNSAVTNITTDLAGAARIREGVVDIGAYECLTAQSGLTQKPIGGSTSACLGGNFSFTINGPSVAPGPYLGTGVLWQLDSGSGFANIVSNSTYRLSTNVNGSTLDIVNATLAMNGQRIRFKLTATNLNNGETVYYVSPATTLSVSAAGPVLYVNAAAANGGDGLSWATAFKDLQSALRYGSCVSEVWVAGGTYRPTTGTDRSAAFRLVPGIAVYGGFSGIETSRAQRNWTSNPTILSGDIGVGGDGGDNSLNVVLFDGTTTSTNTLLDGVVIESGVKGLLLFGSEPTIRNCVIRNNSGSGALITYGTPIFNACSFVGNSSDNGGGVAVFNSAAKFQNCNFSGNSASSGGGVYIQEGAPLFASCVISSNACTGFGGGVEAVLASPTFVNCSMNNNTGTGLWLSHCTPRVENCSFLANSSVSSAGGLASYYSSPVILNCTFRGNSGADGGGISGHSSTLSISNALFGGNFSGSYAGGVAVINGSADIVNATFSGNATLNGNAGGLEGYAATITVRNSILWSNGGTAGSIEEQQFYNAGASNLVRNSCIQAINIYNQSPVGSQNIGRDPLFIQPIAPASAPSLLGDFHLQACSPTFNVGNNFSADGLTVDLDGSPRFVGTIDMGAYEWQTAAAAPLFVSANPGPVTYCPLSTNHFNVTASGSGLSYQWEGSFNGGSNFVALTESTNFIGVTTAALNLSGLTTNFDGSQFRCLVTSDAGCSVRSISATLTVPTPRAYVNAAASNSNGDGTSWATAYKTIQPALASCSTEIWIASGTYIAPNGGFSMKNGVAIYGGFVGTETSLSQRDSRAHETIIHNNQNIYAFSNTGPLNNSALLDGVVIENCNYGDNDAGIENQNFADVMIVNCVFRGNRVGIETRGSNPTIRNCLFETNGIVANTVRISNNGGGIFVAGSAVIESCILRGNSAVTGGGIFSSAGTNAAQVVNCVFSGNYSSSTGGAITHQGSVPITIRNCTITGNRSDGVGAGISASTLNIFNSIVWNNIMTPNSTDELSQFRVVNTAVISNTCLQNVTTAAYLGHGNANVDPMFLMATNPAAAPTTFGDYHLTCVSPLLNAGDTNFIAGYSSDLDGAPRVFFGGVDMGAYELQLAAATFSIVTQPQDIHAGANDQISFNVLPSDSGGTFRWQISHAGGSFTNLSDDATYSGTTTAQLIVTNLMASMDGDIFRCELQSPAGCTLDSKTVAFTFEIPLPEAVDAPFLTFNTGGAIGWLGQIRTSHDGSDAAQSGIIGDSQQTWMETTLVGPGTLTFWWKVSSAANDYLEFYTNSVLQTGRITGEIDWTQKTYTIAAGSNTLRWRYAKNASGTSGQDKGWVDQIVFVPDLPIINTHPANQTIAVDDTVTFSVDAGGQPPLSYQWSFNGTNISGATSSSYTVNGAQYADVGNYAALVSNQRGSVLSSNGVLTVLAADPAVITVQPTNHLGTQGLPTTFSVSATGFGTLHYQWRFNTVDIPGATGSTFTLNSIQPTDAGAYSVFVTNRFGTALSSNAMLSVFTLAEAVDATNLIWSTGGDGAWIPQTNITFDGIDAAQSGSIGDNQESWLETTVNGPGVVNFRWKVSSETNFDTLKFYIDGAVQLGGSISGEVNWTLKSYNVGAGSKTLRWRYVKDDTVSKGANLGWVDNVSFAPAAIITSQPTNLTVVVSNTATFSVGATGTGLGYQWRLNNSPIAGATNASYVIPSAVLANEGNYSVVITNAGGSVTSSSVTLNVLFAPVITAEPQPQSTVSGYDATFSVGVAGRNPLSYQWRKNTLPISGANSSSYTISGVRSGDGANYSVVVTNSDGSVISADALLTVLLQTPNITSQPQSQSVVAGSGVTFSVVANGSIPMSYQWRSNNVNIANATNSSFSIAAVTTNDAASYSVRIVNEAGFTDSQNANLTVLVGPTFATSPTSQTVTQGDNVTLSAVVAGSAPFNYQWQFGGTNISGANSSAYAISGITTNQAGTYTLYVSNAAGTNSASATLTVLAPPIITTQPQGQSVALAGNANFSVVAIGTGPLSYQWQFNSTNISGATTNTYTVANATVDQAGPYQVVITNSVGSVTSSVAILDVQTLPPSITSQPQDQTVAPGASASFSVSASGSAPLTYQWRKDGVAIRGATNVTYLIAYVQYGNAGTYSVVVSNAVGTATSSDALLTVTEFGNTGNIDIPFTSGTGGRANPYPSEAIVSGLSGSISKLTATLHGFNHTYPSDVSVLLVGPGGQKVMLMGKAGGFAYANFLDITFDDAATDPVSGGGLSSGTFQPASYGAPNLPDPAPSGPYANLMSEFNGTSPNGTWSLYVYDDYYDWDGGSVAGGFTLHIETDFGLPPIITQQPIDTAVPVGSNVTFSVAANSSTPLSYQWQKSGADITGATNATFTLTNVQTNDAGTYSVVVGNDDGTTFSSDALLTVQVPPGITAQPQGQTNVVGTSVGFSVTANGDALLAYQWYKNGDIISDATDSSFNIGSVIAADSGDYSVVVTNVAGTITSSNATLLVLAAPVITVQPQGKTNNAGTNVTLSVTVTGTAPLNYQWRQGGVNISGATSSAYTIANLQPVNGGIYSVSITNAAGGVVSSEVLVRVNASNYVAGVPQFTLGAGGRVNAIAYQDDGKMVIGGYFNDVNGVPRNMLARFNTDGTLDMTWNPQPSGMVWSLETKGTNVFAGGQFFFVNGIRQPFFAKISANGAGALDTSWAPAFDNIVYSIQASGTNIYVGGAFNTIDTQSRSHIARLDATTGVVDASWNPGASDTVYSMVSSGTNLYVGGQFTTFAGQTRNRLAKIGADGVLDSAWDPNADNTVQAIVLKGTNIYAGGWFSTMGGQLRGSLAKLDAGGVGATVSTWVNPQINSIVYGLTVVNNDVYVGGSFTFAQGSARSHLAKFNATTGSMDPSWNPNANNNVYAVAGRGQEVVVGGNFTISGVYLRLGLARYLMTTNAPTIVQPPVNTQAVQGGTATFNVAADGTEALSYYWRKDGANVQVTTTGTLTIDNVQPINVGSYSVIVSNANGTATSLVATLSIVNPITLTCPADILANIGYAETQSAPIDFQATADGSPTPGITYQLGGNVITSPYAFPVGTNIVSVTATNGVSSPATCSFTVFVNRAPFVTTDQLVTRKNQSVTTSTQAILSNDIDADGDLLTIVSVSSLSTNGGSVVWNSTNITYTPAGGFAGVDRFSYSVEDIYGAKSVGNVLVTVIVDKATAAIQKTTDSVTLQITGIPGFRYAVQSAPSITGPWTTISGVITADSSGAVTFEDTTLAPTAQFYRMILAP